MLWNLTYFKFSRKKIKLKSNSKVDKSDFW